MESIKRTGGIITLNTIFSKIYVLSIEDSPRREHVQKELQDIKFSFFDAIVPKIDDPRQRQIVGNRKSHMAILRESMANGLKHILVFEDDVILDPDYIYCLKQLNNFIKTRDWAMFYLGGHHRGKSVLTRDVNRILRTRGTIATHAVAYCYWYYKEAIMALKKENNDFTPIDYCFAGPPNEVSPQQTFQQKYPCFVMNPTIAYQIPTESHPLEYWKENY